MTAPDPSPRSACPIGLGCVTFGREIDADAAFAVMDRGVERGVTLFDTAEVYGGGASERIIGAWRRARPNPPPVTVATKVHLPLTRDHLRAAADQSRQRLGVDRLDLLQLHAWDDATPLNETLDALAGLRDAGVIDRVGVSNFTCAQLRAAVDARVVPIDALQLRYNLVCRGPESDLLPFCAEHRIATLVYSPLGAGFLTGKYRRNAMPAGTRFDVAPGHRDLYFSEHAFAVVDRLMELADELAVPAPLLAIGWVMRRGDVTHTLIGARDPAQVDQAFDALRLDVDASVWRRLDALSAPESAGEPAP